MKKFRVRYIRISLISRDTFHYAVYSREWFLGFIPYWRRLRLFSSLSEAKECVEFFKSQPTIGEVLYEV